MEVKRAIELANDRKRVWARVLISGGESVNVRCKRIAAVVWVVPDNGGAFWAADCIEERANATYRVRVEDVLEEDRNG